MEHEEQQQPKPRKPVEEPGRVVDVISRDMARIVHEKLEKISKTQDDHGTKLNDHGAQLRALRRTQRKQTAILKEHSAKHDQHAETLAEHTTILNQHTATLAQHSSQLDNLMLKAEDLTLKADDLTLKAEDLGRTLSVHGDDINRLLGNASAVDRQLHDLRIGQAALGGKVDRILVHLGIAEGE